LSPSARRHACLTEAALSERHHASIAVALAEGLSHIHPSLGVFAGAVPVGGHGVGRDSTPALAAVARAACGHARELHPALAADFLLWRPTREPLVSPLTLRGRRSRT
jgi:hypothetical protein